MPIKYNLTRYDILANKIHKIIVKRAPDQESDPEDDEDLKTIAILIASFSSAHAWQTHKSIVGRETLNKPEIKDEHREAEAERWRQVSSYDIEELAKENISDNIFNEWLFFNVEKEKQQAYKSAWNKLKAEIADGLDINVNEQ